MLTSLALLLVVSTVASASESCFLLAGEPATKPFPSLTQCYKQNQMACCVSAHDETISTAYSGKLSGTCVREYSDLEQFFCLGCLPEADKFITYYNMTASEGAPANYYPYSKGEIKETDLLKDMGADSDPKATTPMTKVKDKYGEIKVCKSFAEKLMYKEDGDKKSVDFYDGCGMMGPEGGLLSSELYALGGPLHQIMAAKAGGKLEKIPMCTWDGKADKDTCKPSNFDVTHEYLFFMNNLPPYYDDFEVSWYETDTEKCFGAGSSVQVGAMAVMVTAVLARMLA